MITTCVHNITKITITPVTYYNGATWRTIAIHDANGIALELHLFPNDNIESIENIEISNAYPFATDIPLNN